eukprot:m.66117 g.66117  ORF g.66117 m.66117 type:complete len:53 (-) comp9800_c0_seq1:1054-1212(-)
MHPPLRTSDAVVYKLSVCSEKLLSQEWLRCASPAGQADVDEREETEGEYKRC